MSKVLIFHDLTKKKFDMTHSTAQGGFGLFGDTIFFAGFSQTFGLDYGTVMWKATTSVKSRMHCKERKHGMNGVITLKTDMTMERKTTWMPFLCIGISIGIFFSCEKDDGQDIIRQATYVYVNKMDDPIRFELYKRTNKSSVEYTLDKEASLVFKVTTEGKAFPFSSQDASDPKGDSLVIRFRGGKCVSYWRIGEQNGTGVFDLTQYDNYSPELINQDPYTLRYSVDSVDYKKSIPCK